MIASDWRQPARRGHRFQPSMTDPPLQRVLLDLEPTGIRIAGWRMLIGCILLGASNRNAVDRVWPVLFTEAKTPDWMLEEFRHDVGRLASIIRPAGCQLVKAERIIHFTQAWQQSVHAELAINHGHVEHLPGCGPYAQESWRVFVEGDLSRPARDHVVEAWRQTILSN